MITKNFLLSATTLCCFTVHSITARIAPQDDPFVQMQKAFEQAEQHMTAARQQIEERFESSNSSFKNDVDGAPKDVNQQWCTNFEVKEDQSSITITFNEVRADGVPEALWQDDEKTLTIVSNGGKAIMSANKNILTIITLNETAQEHDNKEEQFKHYFFSQEIFSQFFNEKIRLEKASIDYAKESQVLSVTIPKEQKAVRKIAVKVS